MALRLEAGTSTLDPRARYYLYLAPALLFHFYHHACFYTHASNPYRIYNTFTTHTTHLCTMGWSTRS